MQLAVHTGFGHELAVDQVFGDDVEEVDELLEIDRGPKGFGLRLSNVFFEGFDVVSIFVVDRARESVI